MGSDELKMRMKSLLRKAGLSQVPRPMLIGASVLCLALVALALWHFWPAGADVDATFEIAEAQGQGSSVDVEAVPADDNVSGASASGGADGTAVQEDDSAQQDTNAATDAVVDVEGAVARPGLVTVPAQARVGDAIEQAGGFTSKAERSSVNLAQHVEDGQQVYVMTKKEAAGSAPGAASAKLSGGAAGASAAGDGLVNLNTASAEELQTLSGIGPALSQRIIDYRDANGPFASVDDLASVSGIGPTRLESLRDAVCV